MKIISEVVKKVGSLRQIAGTRHCMLSNGGANGVRAIDVNTGNGLQYTILPDRGMDISFASYGGVNFTYLSVQEEMNPAFYNCSGNEWLRTFFAGLLTTCGPNSFGPACEDNGEKIGLHGRFNIIPAVDVCDKTEIEEGIIEVKGKINDFVLFGEKVEVKRKIASNVGENVIRITDIITNRGDKDGPYMMLYHINFGYPFLDSGIEISVNSTKIKGYDDYSEKNIKEIGAFSEPNPQNKEKNYLHYFNTSKEGYATVFNKRLGFGVYIKFNPKTLPYLTQWKCEVTRDYVLALEPCNTPCESRKILREKGLLPFLKAGSSIINEIEIGIIS